MIGSTRQGELYRTAELIQEILQEQGLYFVLMFLADVGYSCKDIAKIAEIVRTRGDFK